MNQDPFYWGTFSVLATALVAGLVALSPARAQAEQKLTCPGTARAYADGEISSAGAAEFLKSCVEQRIAALGATAEVEKSKPKGALNPMTCHQYAGKLAVEPGALSAAELAYLETCVDTEIGYLKKGE